MTGFEPATIRLKAEGSTIELHPRNKKHYYVRLLKDLTLYNFKLQRLNAAHLKYMYLL